MSAQISVLFPEQSHVFDLGQEADHRIADSLAMISNLVRVRAATSDAPDPKIFLMEIAERIETVAKLHRLLAVSDANTVKLRDYLWEICNRLGRAVASAKPLLSFICPAEYPVSPRIALPLGLIISELFSNTVKYAHPAGLQAIISLSCTRNETGYITVVYEDDGVGFPNGFDRSNGHHMGIELVQLLSQQLNATSTWSSDSLGMRLQIVIPPLHDGA